MRAGPTLRSPSSRPAKNGAGPGIYPMPSERIAHSGWRFTGAPDVFSIARELWVVAVIAHDPARPGGERTRSSRHPSALTTSWARPRNDGARTAARSGPSDRTATPGRRTTDGVASAAANRSASASADRAAESRRPTTRASGSQNLNGGRRTQRAPTRPAPPAPPVAETRRAVHQPATRTIRRAELISLNLRFWPWTSHAACFTVCGMPDSRRPTVVGLIPRAVRIQLDQDQTQLLVSEIVACLEVKAGSLRRRPRAPRRARRCRRRRGQRLVPGIPQPARRPHPQRQDAPRR